VKSALITASSVPPRQHAQIFFCRRKYLACWVLSIFTDLFSLTRRSSTVLFLFVGKQLHSANFQGQRPLNSSATATAKDDGDLDESWMQSDM
jgi:hypothetical protein